MKQTERGVTISEVLIAMIILGMIMIMGSPALRSFFSRLETTNSVRTAVIALNTARYNAIKKNSSVKVVIINNTFILMEKVNGQWQSFLPFEVERAVTITTNANPVFSPTGTVAPLCTITVKNENHHFAISISMAGRIKISET